MVAAVEPHWQGGRDLQIHLQSHVPTVHVVFHNGKIGSPVSSSRSARSSPPSHLMLTLQLRTHPARLVAQSIERHRESIQSDLKPLLWEGSSARLPANGQPKARPWFACW